MMNFENLADVFDLFRRDDREVLTELQNLHLLPTSMTCRGRNCRRSCTIIRKNNHSFGFVFRCPKCKRCRSIRARTFFDGLAVNFRTVFVLVWLWCCKTSPGLAVHLSDVSGNTVIHMYRYFTQICSWKILQSLDRYRFGGKGRVVQVYQRQITTKKKYQEKWVLSIYGITERRGMVAYIRDWCCDTLTSVFSEHILPGTEIWSDYREEYVDSINAGGVSPFVHTTVTRGKHFEDPTTGAHVNDAETLCKRLLAYLKQRKALASSLLAEHLDAFMWFELYGETPQLAFQNLIAQIAEKFPFK